MNELKNEIYSFALLLDGESLAIGSKKDIKIWHLKKNKIITRLNTTNVFALVQLQNESLASGSSDLNEILIWDLKTRKIIQKLIGHWFSINCLILDNLNGHLISGSYDCTIRIWNNCKTIQTLIGHFDWITCLAFISNDKLASGSYDNTIIIWDLNQNNNNNKTILVGHTDPINCILLVSNKYLASGSKDCTIRIWNILNYTMTKILTQHTGPIRSLALISTNTFATCSNDLTLKIWNLNSNKPIINELTGHDDSVSGLVFISNKNQLISGSFDGTIRIWEVVLKNNCNLGLLNKI
jgi:WD40 repeat protein